MSNTAALTVLQWDGTSVPLSICTCQQPWVSGYEYGDTGCPIDKHAQVARQSTWAFDDQGELYATTEDDA